MRTNPVSRPVILLCFAISVLAIASLVSGAPYLDYSLPGGMPAGNVLAGAGLVALAAVAFGLSRPGTWPRRLSAGTLAAAVAWLPVSIALAGNLALNFRGPRGTFWIWLTLATASAVLAALLLAVLGRCLVARRGGRVDDGRGSPE